MSKHKVGTAHATPWMEKAGKAAEALQPRFVAILAMQWRKAQVVEIPEKR